MLREEVLKHVDETRKIEMYAIAAVAALFAWLAGQPSLRMVPGQCWPPHAWFIGVPLALLGSIRSWALFKRIEEIATYLWQIEQTCLPQLGDLRGWEHYRKEKGGGVLSPTAMAFWVVLLAVTVLAPFILAHLPAPQLKP